MPPLPTVDPAVWEIAHRIFEAKIEHQEVRPSGPGGAGWRLWFGRDAWHLLQQIKVGEPVRVGVQMAEVEIIETGSIYATSILGIPASEDMDGPHRMWRLSTADGRTLRWGEMK